MALLPEPIHFNSGDRKDTNRLELALNTKEKHFLQDFVIENVWKS